MIEQPQPQQIKFDSDLIKLIGVDRTQGSLDGPLSKIEELLMKEYWAQEKTASRLLTEYLWFARGFVFALKCIGKAK